MSSLFARTLAASNAEEQAEFINEFGRYLKKLCALGGSRAEIQIIMIEEHLDADGMYFARKLCESRDA